MDQSLPYQAMCRQAREVQRLWIPARGDVYLCGAEDRVRFWTDPTGPGAFKKGFALFREDRLIRLEARIWLPRQNQLMDLAQIPGVRFQDMTYRFHAFAGKSADRKKNPALRPFSSLEQLWLAFVMTSRFAKYWNGHAWVASAPPTP